MSASSEVRLSERTVMLSDSDSAESSTSMTRQFEHPGSPPHEQSAGSENLSRSVLSGISPSLCAKPSSGITDEFCMISTVSIANTGTSLRHVLRSAFAYCSGTPLSLTDILRSSL